MFFFSVSEASACSASNLEVRTTDESGLGASLIDESELENLTRYVGS